VKGIFSLLVEFGPLTFVAFWLKWRFPGKGRRELLYLGPGFAAAGACCFVGVRYFNLVVFGRGNYLTGHSAEMAALLFLVGGIVAIILHFALNAMFPKWMHSVKKPKHV
jgi:hypothetical protein